MAPEYEARPRADFYDHESEEPRRHRRPAADWGVGEDIFDRMPSRRFNRVDRRAEHHEIVVRRADEDAWAEEAAPRGRAATPRSEDAWAGDEAPRGHAATPRGEGAWVEEETPRGRATGPREIAAWLDDEDSERRRAAGPGRDVASWGDEDADFSGHLMAAPAPPAVDSWMDEAPLVPGESRTIVLGADGAPEPVRELEPARPQRRTVKISGHPDRLPVARTQRPPRTAVERIGASPDRIVAYAVALGFLLVLIAVLTTGH